MLLAEVVSASNSVAATSSRLEKVRYLAELLRRIPPDQLPIVIPFLTGSMRQGRIGVAGATVHVMRDVPAASSPALDVATVDEAFGQIAAAGGPGSSLTRAAALRSLFECATQAEQDFLIRLLFGELRQGALEGVLLDAVARATGVAAADIRRAAMFAGDLTPVAQAVLTGGAGSLSRFTLQPFQPVQPMLAESAGDVADALKELGEASLEYKLDGARIQVHKADDEVRVYSRSLRDVTAAVPEVVTIARAIPGRSFVLDGEAIALQPNGAPRPFQVTMRRFGRKLDVERLHAELPVTPFFFDALFADGQLLVDDPLARRIAVLAERVPAENLVTRLVTSSADEAAAFSLRAMAAGHEGVMAKAINGGYAAGRRGQAWLKVKKARTLDLVILAAEWGSGRRRGTLSNLHLGARDPERGGFVMLGKTFKGLTDEVLAWQTKTFREIEIGREGITVYVRPELVAEIAFNEIQVSSQYPGGFTLRFARVKRYRPDKTASDADTISTVRAIYESLAR
jgi:DNA ligase-1